VLSLLTEADISDVGLPYQRWAQVEVAGIEVLVTRIGFVGELNYELFCPSSQGAFLWNQLLEAGKPFGLVPFGLEALNICRLEKGHVMPGLDTDSFTNLFESSLGWMLDPAKTETVGKPMLDLYAGQELKEQVVGFSVDGRTPVKEGALVVHGGKQLGRVTSILYSPLLDKTIGLALVAPHEDWREGGKLRFWFDSGQEAEADFAKPPFYDPSGARMRM
jgi:sarcosine oxidase subunit alpha